MTGRNGNHGNSQLFLLRLWLEEGSRAISEKTSLDRGDIELEWHGKVQHVVRGEAQAFTSWEGMIACIEAMLMRDIAEPRVPSGTAEEKSSEIKPQPQTERARRQEQS